MLYYSKVKIMKKLSIEDVTDEYLRNARPNQGSLIRESGFKEKAHDDEIAIADFLFSTFGGDIILLKETIEQDDNPDYEWNHRFWDLKSPKGISNLGKLVKKGLSQIFSNHGGIIVDISSVKENTSRIESVIAERMATSMKSSVDVMLVRNHSLIKVLRYKK